MDTLKGTRGELNKKIIELFTELSIGRPERDNSQTLHRKGIEAIISSIDYVSTLEKELKRQGQEIEALKQRI